VESVLRLEGWERFVKELGLEPGAKESPLGTAPGHAAATLRPRHLAAAKVLSSSTGIGKTIVEFFSVEICVSVCR